MNQPINLRAAAEDDEPFLLQLRKLTMTQHLERVAMPVDDEAHYQRIRSNFEDAQIICEAVLKSEVQHLDSYKVLPWKNNINSFSLKSG
jgi:hypothetical protein